jgi:hypothetical protein
MWPTNGIEGDDAGMRTVRLFGVVLGCGAVAALLWAGSAMAAISGTVTDQAHAPIDGIGVCSESTGPFAFEDECTRTDAAGEYTLPGVGPGHWIHFYTRSNEPPGYAQQWYPGVAHRTEAVGVPEADAAAVDAVMAPGGTIAGTVTDNGNGNPIEGVEVCPDNVAFEEGRFYYCDSTDAEGNYALRGLDTGNYRLEFRTAGDVNYIEEMLPSAPNSIPLTAGSSIEEDLAMAPGFKVEGTMTEAGTGLPVEGMPPPFTVPLACALDAATQEKVKCTGPGIGGHYSIPGLPPGRTYAFSFAVDGVEEGLDLPDGYVRQYWSGVTNFAEAGHFSGSARSTLVVNPVLVRGEEVWPGCELPSACAPPPSAGGPAPVVPTPTYTPPVASRPVMRTICGKGRRKVTKGGHSRCVKIHKAHKPAKHHRHRKPTSRR